MTGPASTKDAPTPSESWAKALDNIGGAMRAFTKAPAQVPGRAYDPAMVMRAMTGFAFGLAAQPTRIAELQMKAMNDWASFLHSAFFSPADTAPPVEIPRSDRRFGDPRWSSDPYFRGLRDAYLIAADQMRSAATIVDTQDAPSKAMVDFLLDQYLNAIAPTNFPMTNPEVVRRTVETGGANLAAGFANLLQDVAAGKGVVKRRAAGTFKKGETIAATPGSVVFQNHLFQLIQYDPLTPDVHAEPMLYVPPLVNRYYMIDLQPKSSLVRWLVEQGRAVFVVSWVNPDERHRDCGVEDYVVDGVVAALAAARKATGAKTVDFFSFCLGGTLVSIALAWLQAKGRAGEVGTATLIASMVDFGDMRDWSAFVHEAHLDALDAHLERRGYIDSVELQQLFSAVRANDLIWSSVVNHYLLDRDAPSSDLLYWFEDGARIPEAFLKSYNRGLLLDNKLSSGADFQVRGTAIDLATVKTPMMVIALKDDHVSGWAAVYRGVRHFGGEVTFLLGGSGHNAGVINPPAANKHGYWRNAALPDTAEEWLAGAEKLPGSWWPTWNDWLSAHGSGKRVNAPRPGDGKLAAIEPAPGAYAMAD